MNINQMIIAPVFTNATVLMLFIMPMITMRTYAEEKRSGTIELLLTSPLTDLADHPRASSSGPWASTRRCSRSRCCT